MRATSPLHAGTWLLWAVAAAACIQQAPSPVYVALVIAVSFAVVSSHRLDSTLARAFPLLVTLGVVFAVLRVTLTALTTHTGIPGGPVPDGTWFTLPDATLPRLLGGFSVGGTIEGPVVLAAAAEAFAVVGILAVFGAFNAVASHHELVASTPRAFHEPGLIVSVALAFVPATVGAIAASREADRARTGGRVVRRGRMVRLVVPVVESGMERASALAESMDARGFGRLARGRGDRAAAWLGLASMVSLGGAFVALVGSGASWAEGGRGGAIAVGAGAVGVAGLAGAIVLSSRSSRTTRYRPRPLGRADLAVGVTSVAAPLAVGLVGAFTQARLSWSAYPLRFPEFSLLPVACLALLAVPLAIAPLPRTDDDGAERASVPARLVP